jgi:hypothetical protein
MAAGGFKTFTTGEVLTAADTNNFLMQGVLVFDDAAARDAAITAPVEGQVVYLKDTNAVLSYDGTSYVGVGGSSPLTTKGDLYTFSTVDARLGVGANDTVLTADSGEATGLKWAAPAAGGGMTLLSTTAITGTPSTVTISGISGGYKDLIINITDFYGSSNGTKLRMTFNNDTDNNYRTQNTTSTTPYDSGVIGYLEITETITSASNANSLNVFVNDYTNAFKKNGTSNVSIISSTVLNCSNIDWAYNTTSAITRLDISTSTGTITQGSIKVYGVN